MTSSFTGKKQLITYISFLSDEQCERILNDLYGRLELLQNNSPAPDWNEAQHPRADNGQFAPGGSGRVHMKKSEAEKWDKTGKQVPSSKKITQMKHDLAVEERFRNLYKEDSKDWNFFEERRVKKARELAEAERDLKMERRLDLEGKVSKRILKKKVDEYHDVDEEIDYMEEKYADRDRNSETFMCVVFPKTKAGEKKRQKYEELKNVKRN